MVTLLIALCNKCVSLARFLAVAHGFLLVSCNFSVHVLRFSLSWDDEGPGLPSRLLYLLYRLYLASLAWLGLVLSLCFSSPISNPPFLFPPASSIPSQVSSHSCLEVDLLHPFLSSTSGSGVSQRLFLRAFLGPLILFHKSPGYCGSDA